MIKSTKTVAAAVAASLTIGGFAHAGGMFTHVGLPGGSSAASFDVGSVHIDSVSYSGTFKAKTVGGVTGVGVSGGSVDGEIDNDEYILFSFSSPVYVTSLSLAHLYTAGHYGDLVNEIARVETNLGSFDLEAASAYAGLWSGLGTVINDSAAIEGHGGAWTVFGDDIFGGPITWLRLQSGNPGGSPKGDYGFVAMSVALVPGPAAFPLLLTLALIGGRRRRDD